MCDLTEFCYIPYTVSDVYNERIYFGEEVSVLGLINIHNLSCDVIILDY